jgi:hypothetical protein
VDDEEAHGEAEEPEGGEVEVEAVGEGADVGVLVGGLEAQVGGDLARGGWRRGWVGATRRLVKPWIVQEALGGADVGQGRAGGGPSGGEEGRAGVRKVGEGSVRPMRAPSGERKAVMSDPRRSRTVEGLGGGERGRGPREADARRGALDTGLTSQPARRQRHPGGFEDRAARGRQEAGEAPLAQRLARFGVGGAGLGVDGLDAGPERGGESEARDRA